jgi:hypothetical protein
MVLHTPAKEDSEDVFADEGEACAGERWTEQPHAGNGFDLTRIRRKNAVHAQTVIGASV